MRSGFAMRALGGWALALAVLWMAVPGAAQSIVVAVDPDTDAEDEDFAGVVDADGELFTSDLFITADTLADAINIVRENPSIGELWIVRKDNGGVWDEVFPTLGGASEDAVNALAIRGFPFDAPWRTIIAPSGEIFTPDDDDDDLDSEAAIRIESVSSTDIVIEGITVRAGAPAILITTPADAEAGSAGEVVIDRCIIRNATGDGIEVSGVADVQVYNTSIFRNSGDGIYVGPEATADIQYVSILENSGVGLYADGEVDLNPAVVTTLEPDDDATIEERAPDDNFGAEPDLRVRADAVPPGDDFRTEALLTFVPPNLTGIASIESATLVLHDTRAATDTPDEGITAVHATGQPPAPIPCASCVTWNTAPVKAGIMDSQTYDQPGSAYAFDVTVAFERLCDEPPCDLIERISFRVGHSLAEDSDPDGEPPLFASSDNGSPALRPSITLEVIDDEGDTQTLTLLVDIAVPGPEDEPVDCECALDPLQPFPGDTILLQEFPNLPSGEETSGAFALTAFGGDLITPGQHDSLLRFVIEDLEPGKPASATLRLTALQFPEGATVTLFGAVNPNRPVGTDGQAGAVEWDEDTVTWSDPDAPVGVRVFAPLDDTLFPLAAAVDPSGPQVFEFDVTPWVQGNGAISFRIESDSEEDGQHFSSKEGDFPPELVIAWQEDDDPIDPEEVTVVINNSLVWENAQGAFFEGKPGIIQQGSQPFDTPENEENGDGEDAPQISMHVDDLGEIFDRDPPATASDPRVLRNVTDFPGRIIENEDDPSPLLSRGDGLPVGHGLDLDFDLRPSTGADIGADQLESVSAGPVTWFYSTVTPPPGCFNQQGLVGDPIGVVNAGELRVEIRVRSEGAGVDATPDAVFLLPQDHMRRLVPALGGGRLEATFVGGLLNEILGFAPEESAAVRIPLEVIRLEPQALVRGTTSVWIGTNSNPIDTRLLAGPGDGATFTAADTFADGHAVVMLAYDPAGPVGNASIEDGRLNVVGDEGLIGGGINALDEEGIIIDQALVGRHVLIDTIAPRFNFEAFGDNPTAGQFIAQPVFPDGGNDRLLPSMLPADTHPFPSPPATGPRIAGVWSPATIEAPADSGALVDNSFVPPRAGIGGNIFYNHASIANRSQPEPFEAGGIPGTFDSADPLQNSLRARIQVSFIDPTLEEYHGIVYDANNPPPFNPFTNSSARPVAGFRPTGIVPFNIEFETTVGDLLADSVEDLFPMLWGYASDSRRFNANALVQVLYDVDSRAVLEPLLAGQTGDPLEGVVVDFEALRAGDFDTSVFHRDAAIAGSWHFTPQTGAAPGTNPLGSLFFEDHISNNHFVARLLFRGRDAACNLTPTQLSERTMGPLNLWWIVNTDTRMTRHTDGDDIELGEASFDWELARGYSTRSFGQPQPVFTWRIFATDADEYDAPNAQFVPITPWQPWQQERTTRPGLTAEEFESFANANPDAFYDRWLLFVAVGADEAGNVTKWPFEDWQGDPNSFVVNLGGQRERANWVRVRVNREQTARARVAGEFWWKPAPVGLQLRPPEGATVYRSVVPLPPRPIAADAIGRNNLAVYAKFTIDLGGISVGPGEEASLLFDMRRRGSSGPLVTGMGVDSYGARIPLPDPNVRRVQVFLPLIAGGPSVGFALAEDGAELAALVFQDNDPRFTWPIGTGGPFVLGDQTRQSAEEYVVRAAVWVGPAGALLPQSDRELQASPGNFRFTVVPDATRARYFRPRYSPEDQPIRVREQQ